MLHGLHNQNILKICDLTMTDHNLRAYVHRILDHMLLEIFGTLAVDDTGIHLVNDCIPLVQVHTYTDEVQGHDVKRDNVHRI